MPGLVHDRAFARSSNGSTIDHGRKLSRRPYISPSEDEKSIPDTNPLPYHQALAHECLRKIPQEYREVVMLTIMAGFTAAQAAAILKISEDTVEDRKHRAIERLRHLLLAAASGWREQPGEVL
jgi:RNA polymerase sigma-70 factor (ECF subfamily)